MPNKASCICLWSMGSLILSVPAMAREQSGERAPASKQSAARIDDIVVTARRQREPMQDAPLSVTALSGEALERINANQIDKMAQVTPNVVLSVTPGSLTALAPFIRGIGNQDPLLTLDSPVGIYLDGVYLGRNAGSNLNLVDIERVEVLRGPQGSLFGRNTTGGAISVISRAPADTPGGSAKLGYGRFQEWNARLMLDSGRIGSSGIAIKAAYAHQRRNGYVDNPYAPSRDDPGALRGDSFWVRANGSFGKLTADYTFDYSLMRGQQPGFQITALSPDAAAYFGASPFFGGSSIVVADKRLSTLPLRYAGQHMRNRTQGHALTLEYAASDAIALKSITSWRKWTGFQPNNYTRPGMMGFVLDPVTYAPAGVAPVVTFYSDNRQRQSQFSQEFQLLGKSGRWSYVAGLYYFREKVAEHNVSIITFPLAGGQAGLNLSPETYYDGVSKSLALFGQVSFQASAPLELTLGARYTVDKRRIHQDNPVSIGGAALDREGHSKFDNFSFNGTVKYRWSPAFMTYARIGTGYRSGGFNGRATSPNDPFAYRPEKATSYEAGFKSDLLDRRLRINGTVFHTIYKDLQVAQFAGVFSGSTRNASAKYTGFELELTAKPVSAVGLDASLGYVKPRYKQFPYPDPASPGTLKNYADQAYFPYVPNWSVHLGGDYTVPLDFGRLILRGDYSYSSKRHFFALSLPNANPLNEAIRDPGQNLLSARLSLSDVNLGSSKLEASVFGENLLNDQLRTSGIDFGSLGFAGVTYGMPRRWGVEVKLDF